jgi:hypothetical protein
MTGPSPAPAHALVSASESETDRYVVPQHLATPATGRGPQFRDDVWDFRPFVPRTTRRTRANFTRLPDPVATLTAKQYVYSRIHRPIPTAHYGAAAGARPLKLTGAALETQVFTRIVTQLREQGAPRLRDVKQEHLDALVRRWRRTCSPTTVAQQMAFVRRIAAHGPHLSADRLTIIPWGAHRAADEASLWSPENTTPRIPEPILAPMLHAALFYVHTASGDLLAAAREIVGLQAARSPGPLPKGAAARRVTAFIEKRRRAGRGIPALPSHEAGKRPGAAIVGGVVQAPNTSLADLLAGVRCGQRVLHLYQQAGVELGYEEGGLDTPMSPWPATAAPWRPRLERASLATETGHLRTACWIVIAYLSGMRDAEVRELRRDCMATTIGEDGRVRHLLRGRVFKHRKLAGDDAEWVVLDVVHQAVEVLLQLNDDPTHLFGRKYATSAYRLMKDPTRRLREFRDHINQLFSSPDQPFVPLDGDQPWPFTPSQWRRTLAWHIAHQPFGVIAGARQYQHAKIAMFEGYAGASASGFAAEVAAEEAVAMLDYVEELYRDWNDGARSAGPAGPTIDAEFDRIRREIGDLPGVVADPLRLRALLRHLTKTLHPGVLNDCFFNPDTAVCVKRAKVIGRPVPQHNMCLRCPNARRSSIHRPRLLAARQQAQLLQKQCAKAGPMPVLQQHAISTHVAELDQVINELDTAGTP